jgi:hypothetical protein
VKLKDVVSDDGFPLINCLILKLYKVFGESPVKLKGLFGDESANEALVEVFV